MVISHLELGYVTSEVLIGAGLSSSAAFETLIGTILSYMYNGGEVNPIEIAKIGQYAENVYFGKPCGLMDQMACSVGSLIHIDFADPENPIVEQLKFDLNTYGYSLCITDTKGTHTDLTPDYAAIPQEMKKAAECLGKNFLGEVSKEEIINNITRIRDCAGDRAALRALHFVCENERVKEEVDALKKNNFPQFLTKVKESGDSSFKYLQNVYTCHDVQHQNVFEKEEIDGVIHFAANSQVGESMVNPLKYYNNNLCGTEVLLESMVAHGVNKIVFSSTAATYGEPERIPILETDRTVPTNCYGETKLSMEKMFKWTANAHDLRFVSLRYFNACGAHPNGKIGEAHNPETHLIPLILQVPNGKREYISIFGNDYDTKDGT